MTAAIDAAFYLRLTLDGDRTVAAYQRRVAVSLNTLASTEYVTSNDSFVLFVFFFTYRHNRILLHTSNLTTAIDGASHFAVGNGDTCATIVFTIFSYHGNRTSEGTFAAFFCFTLAAAEHVAGYGSCVTSRGDGHFFA